MCDVDIPIWDAYACVRRQLLDVFLNCALPYFLRQLLSLNPELLNWAVLASHVLQVSTGFAPATQNLQTCDMMASVNMGVGDGNLVL